ncbi:LINE-1 retrotransposable element ORF1 protein [Plecturocebus cupreus]
MTYEVLYMLVSISKPTLQGTQPIAYYLSELEGTWDNSMSWLTNQHLKALSTLMVQAGPPQEQIICMSGCTKPKSASTSSRQDTISEDVWKYLDVQAEVCYRSRSLMENLCKGSAERKCGVGAYPFNRVPTGALPILDAKKSKITVAAGPLSGVPECDGEKESKLENTLQDVIQENFPNLASQATIQVQKIKRTPQRYSSERATPRHIIVRFTRIEMKEKMLRAAREKGWVTHKGKPIRLTADLSAETLQARREWGPAFNILKEKNFQLRISYPAKLSFISEGEIKSFTDKQVVRDFITTRPALQELLKEALNKERNNQYQPLQKCTKWHTAKPHPSPLHSWQSQWQLSLGSEYCRILEQRQERVFKVSVSSQDIIANSSKNILDMLHSSSTSTSPKNEERINTICIRVLLSVPEPQSTENLKSSQSPREGIIHSINIKTYLTQGTGLVNKTDMVPVLMRLAFQMGRQQNLYQAPNNGIQVALTDLLLFSPGLFDLRLLIESLTSLRNSHIERDPRWPTNNSSGT